MEKERFEYSENLINKAEILISKAKEEPTRYPRSYSNVISWCQQAIELSVKAIFKLMDLEFPLEHQLLFDFEKKGPKVRKEVIELLRKEFPQNFVYKKEIPRVIFLTYFWFNFHTIARYGIEELNFPPDKLFEEADAKLALDHAKYCVNVAQNLLFSKKVLLRNFIEK